MISSKRRSMFMPTTPAPMAALRGDAASARELRFRTHRCDNSRKGQRGTRRRRTDGFGVPCMRAGKAGCCLTCLFCRIRPFRFSEARRRRRAAQIHDHAAISGVNRGPHGPGSGLLVGAQLEVAIDGAGAVELAVLEEVVLQVQRIVVRMRVVGPVPHTDVAREEPRNSKHVRSTDWREARTFGGGATRVEGNRVAHRLSRWGPAWSDFSGGRLKRANDAIREPAGRGLRFDGREGCGCARSGRESQHGDDACGLGVHDDCPRGWRVVLQVRSELEVHAYGYSLGFGLPVVAQEPGPGFATGSQAHFFQPAGVALAGKPASAKVTSGARMVGDNVLMVMTALPEWMEKCAPPGGVVGPRAGVTHTFGFCEPEFLLNF